MKRKLSDLSREALFKYWRTLNDGKNRFEDYEKRTLRSEMLVSIINRLPITHEQPIIELGSGIGRNLFYLSQVGYQDLTGIELNIEAVDYMSKTYNIQANMLICPVENIISNLSQSHYFVFTMAFLEHLHPDSEFVFDEMIRISSQYIVTIEDESSISDRHFPRNYREVFETRGLRQIKGWQNLKGLPSTFKARVFTKEEIK